MEVLELTSDQKRSVSNYKRMGIDIEFLDEETVKITQSRLVNGYILNQKELVSRAKEVAPEAKVIPVVYSLDVDNINIAWIEARMEEFGIKRNDLIKQLAIDKASLSSMFNGDRGLTKSQKAAFFFYFLTYELNRDFRESEKIKDDEANKLEVNSKYVGLFAEITRIITSNPHYSIKNITIEDNALIIQINDHESEPYKDSNLLFRLDHTDMMYKLGKLESFLHERIVL